MPLSRDRLSRLPMERLHSGRNVTKPVVDLARDGEHLLVIKDLAGRPWPVRLLLGPAQLDREVRAYRHLRGLPGVARFLGRIDRQAIALEHIPGPDLGTARPGTIEPSFFDRLERMVDGIHARGVAHGDLGCRDILVGPGESPYIVDFSTSLVAGCDADPLIRFLFSQMCRADRRAVAKIRRRFLGRQESPIPARPGLYRIGRGLKRIVDRLRGRH